MVSVVSIPSYPHMQAIAQFTETDGFFIAYLFDGSDRYAPVGLVGFARIMQAFTRVAI